MTLVQRVLPVRAMRLPPLARYGVAISTAGVAVLLRLALDPLWGPKLPLILFFPAIMVSGWFGGFWPGICTTLISAAAADYFWMAPAHSLALNDWGDLVGLLLFIGVGAVISGFNEAWRSAAAGLSESEERLRVTLGSIGDAVITTDDRGCVSRLNGVAQALTGWTKNEAKGRSIQEIFVIVNEETRRPAENLVERILREGAVSGLGNHTVLLSKDGREIPIDDSAAPIRDADGRVVGAVVVFRDVTDRRRAERERAWLLEQERAARSKAETSEHQLLLALESGRMGTWQWTIGTSEVKWSPGLEAIHGFAPGSFPGTFEAFRKEIHPQDRDRVLRDISQAVEGARKYHIEYRIIRPDGAVRWVEGRGQLFGDAQGRPEQMVGVCTDVTERKQEEERFHLAVEAAPAAMIIADREGTILFVNASTESLLGYTRNELAGLSIDLLVPMRFRERHGVHRRSFTADPRQRPMGAGRDLYALRKDGSEVPVEIGLSPIETAEGLVVLAAITDITERKRVEGERENLLAREQAARREIEQASVLKDQFLTVLSHELRTPLSAVLGWARLLSSGSLPPDRAREAAEAIERNAQAEARLVDSLLDVSRIRAGKLKLELERVDLCSVVQAAVDMFRPEAEGKGLKLEAVVPPSPVVIAGDGARLQQIVWNLVSNAVKFTPRGGRVQARLGVEDSHAEIRVTDDGEGIDSELLPHVFDRFTQGDTTKGRAYSGLGLGLTIVRELVQAHGGTVSAESPGPGRGSVFTVTLPLAAAASVPGEPKAVPVQTSVAEEPVPSVAALKVLIVDDDPETRDLLALTLESHGAAVRTVSSVAEALEFIRKSRLDVLLADIRMPEGDGYRLIRDLRASERQGRRKRLPAIAVTAYAGPSDREKALAEGYDGHLAKPVEPAELVRALAKLVRDSRGSSKADAGLTRASAPPGNPR